MKNLSKKHLNPVHMAAKSLYEVVKQKSENFRDQRGNRYTRAEEIAEYDGAELEVENEITVAALAVLDREVARAIKLAGNISLAARKVEEAHDRTVKAGRSVVNAVRRDVDVRPSPGPTEADVEAKMNECVREFDKRQAKEQRTQSPVKEEIVVIER